MCVCRVPMTIDTVVQALDRGHVMNPIDLCRVPNAPRLPGP